MEAKRTPALSRPCAYNSWKYSDPNIDSTFHKFSKKLQFIVNKQLKNVNKLYLSVPLSDPTCYAPVIDYVRSMAETMQDGQNYVVLLIITDGGISGIFFLKS